MLVNRSPVRRRQRRQSYSERARAYTGVNRRRLGPYTNFAAAMQAYAIADARHERRRGGDAMGDLTHIDDRGRARMVDVSAKNVTARRAVAGAKLVMKPGTLTRILEGELPKGDVLAVARTAGILAAKQTSSLIPLCHPLPIDAVQVDFEPQGAGILAVSATVMVTARTGAEMEALVAVSIAGLTVYDMCKAVDRSMMLTEVVLLEKSGGKSGDYARSV
jgi:cyclic pyranopterin phosphate synthase